LQEIISRQLQTGIFKEPTRVYVEKMADKERVEAELKLLKGVVKSYKKNKLQSEADNVKFQQFNSEKADLIWQKIIDESEWLDRKAFEYQYLHDGKYTISNASNSELNLKGNF